VAITDFYPLTPMQSGMMFHSLLDPESGVYFEQFTYEISGPLDVEAYRAAWEKTVARNAILRASVHWEGLDEPVQVIHDNAKPQWTTVDLRDISDKETQKGRIEAFIREDRARGFALNEAPLIRMALFRLSDRASLLLLSYHHLILDAWSLFILLKESVTFYEHHGGNSEPPLAAPRNFRRYVESQRVRDLSSTRAFWSDTLSGLGARTNLGRPIPGNNASPLNDHAEDFFELGTDLTTQLEQYCKAHRLTVNTVVQAAWGLLLAHNTAQTDVVFGITISHRPVEIPKIEEMVGIFINSLPIRLQVEEKTEVLPWLRQVQKRQVAARSHEHAPLIDIQNASSLGASEPLFDTLLIFENFPRNDVWRGTDTLKIRQERYVGYTNYPLAIEAMPFESLMFQVKFDLAAFSREEVTRHLQDFGTLIQVIVGNTGQTLGDVLSVLQTAATIDRTQPVGGPRRTATGATLPEHEHLARIFSDVMKKPVSVDDDFFDIGGDSLVALRIVAAAVAAGIDLSLRNIFESRIIKAMVPKRLAA
jgi:hypothetical protein